MQVEQVDFVSVPTRDTDRAVAWYRDVLGLRPSETTAGEVETPNVTLSFWSPEADGEVRAAGAEVIGIEDTGVCHMGFVKDPDGNVLILHRRYAPRG
jgi:Glyoxalase/Bleomycin resistance protein/Dioxygenase superfamily